MELTWIVLLLVLTTAGPGDAAPSGGDDRCVFDFERASSDRPYGFSHLAEESPLPEGKDYHVRIPVIKTDYGINNCSVGLKLPETEGKEGFLTLHHWKKCKNPVRGDKVHQTQYTPCTHMYLDSEKYLPCKIHNH